MYSVKYLRRKKAWYTTPVIDEELKKKKKKSNRKPGWDSTQQDFSKFKLAPEEIERRKTQRISRNLPKILASKDGYDSDVSSGSQPSSQSHNLRDVYSKVAWELQQEQGQSRNVAYAAGHSGNNESVESLPPTRHHKEDDVYDHPSTGPSRTTRVQIESISTTPSSAEKPGAHHSPHTEAGQINPGTFSSHSDQTHTRVAALESEVADLKLKVSSLTQQASLQDSRFQEYTTHTSSIISRLQKQLQELFNTTPQLMMSSPAAAASIADQPSSASLSSRSDNSSHPPHPTHPTHSSRPPSRTISTVVPHHPVVSVQPMSRFPDSLPELPVPHHYSPHPSSRSHNAQSAHEPSPQHHSNYTVASSGKSQQHASTSAQHADRYPSAVTTHRPPSLPSSAPALQQEASLPSYRELRNRTAVTPITTTNHHPAATSGDINKPISDQFMKPHGPTFKSLHSTTPRFAQGVHTSSAHPTRISANGMNQTFTPQALNSMPPSNGHEPTRYALYADSEPHSTHDKRTPNQHADQYTQHPAESSVNTSRSDACRSNFSPTCKPPPTSTPAATFGDHILTATQRLHTLHNGSSTSLYPLVSIDHLPDLSRGMYNPPASYLAQRHPPQPRPAVKAVRASDTLSFNAFSASVANSTDSWT